MARTVTVTFDDGSTHLYQNVPDSATPDQVEARAAQDFAGRKVTSLDGGKAGGPAAPSTGNSAIHDQIAARVANDPISQGAKGVPSILGELARQTGNLAAGAVRGAGSIGATLMYPIDKAQDLYYGDRDPGLTSLVTGQAPLSRNQERRASMDWALKDLGADPDSLAYKVGKVGAEIAGTAGAGGVIANTVGRAAPVVAEVAPNLLQAIRTGGMSAGTATGATNALTRVTGGAVNGGASAAMVDPSKAGTGAVIGAIAPPAIQGVGALAKGAGTLAAMGADEFANLFKGDTTRGAQDLMRALDITPDQLPAVIAKLKGAPTLVDGSAPTVAQALSSPQASILDRVVAAGPGGEKLRQTVVAQAQARMAALRGVAPVNPSGLADTRTDFGNAITRLVVPQEREASNQITQMYGNIDPAGNAAIPLPTGPMRAAVDRFQGAGSFGRNQDPANALRTAEDLSPMQNNVAPGMGSAAGTQMSPRPANWAEVNQLRSSINEAWQRARDQGDNQAAAALGAQKDALDEAINRHLPPDSLASFMEANASHASKMEQFHTGPQASIFATRNGEPLAQGGQVPGLFWNGSPGVAGDVNAFRRLVGDNPSMLGQFKSLVTTDAADKAGQGGVLGQKYVDWVKQRLPGLRNAFTPDEVQTFQNIAQDIQRAGSAATLGKGVGSNTYQNAANALDAGLIDSPGAKALASRIPGLRMIAEPIRANLADSASKAKGARLADLLSSADGAAEALQTQDPNAIEAAILQAGRAGKRIYTGKIPGTNMNLLESLAQGSYRAPAVISADQR